MHTPRQCALWHLVGGLVVAGLAAAAPVELLPNGGFEDTEKDLPKGWEVNNAGKLTLLSEARSGARAVRFDAIAHDWGFCAFAAGGIALAPRATYRLSIWARGTGELELAVYQSSAAGFVGTQFLKPHLVLSPEWQQLTVSFRTDDLRVRRGAFAVHLFGANASASFDDAAFTFNPDENPGISIASEKPAIRALEFTVSARAADVTLVVAGKPVPVTGGKAVAEIAEGLVVVGVQAKATGEGSAVGVRLSGQPETDGRWRTAAAEQPDWTEAGFDDSKWPAAVPDAQGLIPVGGVGQALFLRQVILWNATHYGPNRCLIPPVREWGFPRGSTETFYLALYSPLPRRLQDYEFVLDMPEAFTVLNKTDYWQRYIMNNPAQRLTSEPVTRDGTRYTRFRMSHAASEVTPEQTQYSLIPVRQAGAFSGETCRFYFRRQAQVNFTEMEQALPVRILPEINGRRPGNIMISQYAPMGYSPPSPEHLAERIRADTAAGCNTYVVGFSPGWGENWQAFMKRFHDTVSDAGARVVLWMNYPLNYGGIEKGHLARYPDWIAAHSEAHGVYYKGTPAWGAAPAAYPYCNQFVITDAGQEFWDVVKQEYRRALEFYPKASMFFSDWEFHNVQKDGGGVHCFCDRCKAAFREFAKLPGDADLADEAIMQRWRTEWLGFRDWQDGEIQRRMAGVCHALGRQYMTYSWSSNDGFWAACKDKIDVAFAGCPGNSVADSHYQKGLDEFAVGFRERTGLKRALGQRFVFFHDVNKDGWQAQVLSHDGFVQPKSWKTQVLRVVAALGGGVDLQNSFEFVAGLRYWLGEATRIISEFEPLFWEGERADDLATCDGLAYPNVLVLRRSDERLVLLFNEAPTPVVVTLRNRDVPAGQTATVYGTDVRTDTPAEMRLTVPAEDVAVVHIH